MSLNDIIKSDLSSIFASHITKSITYSGNVYSAISSDIISLSDYQNAGIFEQSDLTLIFQTSDFTIKGIVPKTLEGKTITIESITMKINKVTESSDGNKFTLEISKLKNK